ncbi:uncharacterized protein LOC123969151 [Micropterus dolomieu]|uniref:uncharacterized protein LOC123969151 n=1 Tax=Micropterus dolomieu TaxID=147949 RepID=UPI001E8D24CB|nr:uncharacterized protein LOC123969151 [Micropterus dolomieu]
MTILQCIMFCCLAAACVEASAVLEVSGHVGGEVTVRCSGSWTTDNSSEHHNMYFCKEVCSRENILIQTERRRAAVTLRGRYSVEVNRGDFNVTIKRLKGADAGRYHCGVGNTLNVLYQKINLIVLDASTVPPGSSPSTTSLQTEAQTQPQGSFPSSSESAALTLPATEEKTNHKAATKLSDTTVVIIVSVSLALLVCAVIPLIFYGHCQSSVEDENRPEGSMADYCEESADVASTQAAVRLQSFEPDAGQGSSAQDASQYAAIYQALDPKSLD